MGVTKRTPDGTAYFHDTWDVGIIPSGPGSVWVDFGSGGCVVDEETFDAIRECFRAYERDHPADAQDDEVTEEKS